MEQNHNEALLTEYQVCQAERSRQDAGFWSFAGIFLGLSIAGFGIITPNIFSIQDIRFDIFITFISVGMIVIYWTMNFILHRTNERNNYFRNRMIAIEAQMGMRAITEDQRLGGLSGEGAWRIIITTLSILWILAIVLTWSCKSA